MILDGDISYEDNGTSEGGRAGHDSRERERSGKDTEQYGVMMRRMATENLGEEHSRQRRGGCKGLEEGEREAYSMNRPRSPVAESL